MKLVPLIVLFVTLAGCATYPTPVNQAKALPPDRAYSFQSAQTDDSLVIVVRDSGALNRTCKAAVYVDGELAAELKREEKVVLHVPAGHHIVGTGPIGSGWCAIGRESQRREISISTHKNERVHVRLYVDRSTGFGLMSTAY